MTSRKFQNKAQAIHEEKHTKEMREQSSSNTSTNATQDRRENSICSACKHKQNQLGHASRTGSDRDNKYGEGLEGQANKRNAVTCVSCKSVLCRPENAGHVVATTGLEAAIDKVSEEGLNRFWKKKKRAFRSDPSSDIVKKLKKDVFTDQDYSVATPKAKHVEAEKKLLHTRKPASHDSSARVSHDIDARHALPGPRSSKAKAANSNTIVTPNKVKKALSLFRALCGTLEEEKSKKDGIGRRRVDCQAAQILKDNLRDIKFDKPILGSIPGIEVNDCFLYRMELAIVGLHRPPQSGIDYVKQQCGRCLAASIVASGGYENDVRDPDTLVYVGQGGRVTRNNKEPEDQILERGNRALKNSIEAKNPVRFIRTTMVACSSKGESVEMYTYAGVYWVTKYWSELGPERKLIYKFRLQRIPDQPKLKL